MISQWTDVREGLLFFGESVPYKGFVSVKAEGTSTCQACGAQVPVDVDFCPVCALRGALNVGNETVELSIAPTISLPAGPFEHYCEKPGLIGSWPEQSGITEGCIPILCN